METTEKKLGLDRLYKLFLRYEKRTRQGVEDGFLFFNEDQVVAHAGKMARWHLGTEAKQ
jgi:hypothetical protein